MFTEGFVYGQIKKTLYLPKKLRAKLRQPLGELAKDNPWKGLSFKRTILIAVGDVSTKLLNEKKIKIDLAIVDFKVRRKKARASRDSLSIFFKKNREIKEIPQNSPKKTCSKSKDPRN